MESYENGMEVDGTGSRMTAVKALVFAVYPQIYCLKMFRTVSLRNLVGHSVPPGTTQSPSTFKFMLKTVPVFCPITTLT